LNRHDAKIAKTIQKKRKYRKMKFSPIFRFLSVRVD